MSRILVLLLFFAGMAVSAQDEKESILSPHERAVKMTYVMAEELSLTPVQKDTVYHINFKMLKVQEQTDRPVEEIQEEYYQALESVLTEKQHDMFIEQQHGTSKHPVQKKSDLSPEEAPEDSKLKDVYSRDE